LTDNETTAKEAAGWHRSMTYIESKTVHSPYEREGSNMKALASVVLDDCFVVNNITILEGKNGINFVAMPGYKI